MLIAPDGRSKRKIKPSVLTVVFCLIPLFCATAHAEERYMVCIGDRNFCQGTGPSFSCGTSVQQAAQAVCTTSTSSEQTISQFTIVKLSDKPGGQCGYAMYEVTCKK
jgi:hypothetical protein